MRRNARLNNSFADVFVGAGIHSAELLTTRYPSGVPILIEQAFVFGQAHLHRVVPDVDRRRSLHEPEVESVPINKYIRSAKLRSAILRCIVGYISEIAVRYPPAAYEYIVLHMNSSVGRRDSQKQPARSIINKRVVG